jgi:hypothetical protein
MQCLKQTVEHTKQNKRALSFCNFYCDFINLNQWFPTCGTRTPGVCENNIGNGRKHQKKGS